MFRILVAFISCTTFFYFSFSVGLLSWVTFFVCHPSHSVFLEIICYCTTQVSKQSRGFILFYFTSRCNTRTSWWLPNLWHACVIFTLCLLNCLPSCNCTGGLAGFYVQFPILDLCILFACISTNCSIDGIMVLEAGFPDFLATFPPLFFAWLHQTGKYECATSCQVRRCEFLECTQNNGRCTPFLGIVQNIGSLLSLFPKPLLVVGTQPMDIAYTFFVWTKTATYHTCQLLFPLWKAT